MASATDCPARGARCRALRETAAYMSVRTPTVPLRHDRTGDSSLCARRHSGDRRGNRCGTPKARSGRRTAHSRRRARIEMYDAVVLEIAVYGGHWLTPARQLVESNARHPRRAPGLAVRAAPSVTLPRARTEDGRGPVDLPALREATRPGGQAFRSTSKQVRERALAFGDALRLIVGIRYGSSASVLLGELVGAVLRVGIGVGGLQ